jgi:hypothetical protein
MTECEFDFDDCLTETYVVNKSYPSILVIGPDRVGKTTLVSHISRLLGIPMFKAPSEKEIFKNGGRESLAFDYTLTHFLEQTKSRFVSDRGYPCEWVYSKVFNRKSDPLLIEKIDHRHALLDTRIMYVYSSVEPFEEDDLVPKEKYWDVKQMYDNFCNYTKCKVTKVDTELMLKAFQNKDDNSMHFAKSSIIRMGL